MSNLLFVSNSFDDYILTNISDLCLDISVESIILLKEYHNYNEFKNKTIVLSNSLEEAIQKADKIVFLSDSFQKKELRSKIFRLASNYEKNVLEIKNPWINAKQKIESGFLEDYHNKVVILILAFDVRLQTFGEMIINKIMGSFNVGFKQNFSLPTQNLISGLGEIVRKDLIDDGLDSNIIIESMKLKNSLYASVENYDVYQKIQSLNPDYVILCTNQEYTNEMNQELVNILKYAGRTNLNFVLQSDYIYISEWDKHIFLESPFLYEIDNLLNLQDLNLENIIKNDIVKRFAYPKDISIIR